MRLNRVGYYCEFILCPIAVAILAALSFRGTTSWPVWALTAAGGIAVWTLVEYLMHRFVFHHLPYVRGMHARHHEEHDALVGTPAWLSLPAIAAAAAGLILALGPEPGGAFATGLSLGYCWYISIHHIAHRWRLPDHGYAFRLKRRHALHHHFDDNANFGVTSGLWDTVFGTNVSARGRAHARTGYRVAGGGT